MVQAPRTENNTPKNSNKGVNESGSLAEPFRTRVIGTDGGLDTLSPGFVVRNLDENPHTGLTPTVQTFGLQKESRPSSQLSNSVQVPSPPASPSLSPDIFRSRIPRRSKDDLSITESLKKSQAASISNKPRRTSLHAPLTINTLLDTPDSEMTVALAPPAPITIPPNDFTNGYIPSENTPADKTPAKSPSTFASLFRWNTTPVDRSPDRLTTPSTLSNPTSPMTPNSPRISALEQELKAVSADLAISIRREMDLEDVITRLQEEVIRLGGDGKRHMRFRTSDYFSDESSGGSPPLSAVDCSDPKSNFRVSSVALEDVRLANEKVTQLEKEVLRLKHDNLELTSQKRDLEKRFKDQMSIKSDSKKIQELEGTVRELRKEVFEKTQTIEKLEKSAKHNDQTKADHAKYEEEIHKLTERAKGAENQREALQLALRQLRERQELEAKKASDRIKQLESGKEKAQRTQPRTPDRAVTGITHRAPDAVKRPNTKALEGKIAQLIADLSKSNRDMDALTLTNTQLSNENARLRDMQQKLQSRLTQVEGSASASTIGEASATASLSYAHRLAVEMARVTDIHVKSLEKVRCAANANLPQSQNGNPISPLLQSAYNMSLSPKRLSWQRQGGEEPSVKRMEGRIKELESALQQSSEEMGEVVRKMQVAQIEMIELAGERDEALRRERKLLIEGVKVPVNAMIRAKE